jgi:hypothetical protein
MCDQDHYEDDLKRYMAGGNVTRREFGALSVGAGIAALLPRCGQRAGGDRVGREDYDA